MARVNVTSNGEPLGTHFAESALDAIKQVIDKAGYSSVDECRALGFELTAERIYD